MLYKITRKELKNRRALEFKDGDFIEVGKYCIHIKYTSGQKRFKRPSMLSLVEEINTNRFLRCTPGVGWPYYIADFLHR